VIAKVCPGARNGSHQVRPARQMATFT